MREFNASESQDVSFIGVPEMSKMRDEEIRFQPGLFVATDGNVAATTSGGNLEPT